MEQCQYGILTQNKTNQSTAISFLREMLNVYSSYNDNPEHNSYKVNSNFMKNTSISMADPGEFSIKIGKCKIIIKKFNSVDSPINVEISNPYGYSIYTIRKIDKINDTEIIKSPGVRVLETNLPEIDYSKLKKFQDQLVVDLKEFQDDKQYQEAMSFFKHSVEVL